MKEKSSHNTFTELILIFCKHCIDKSKCLDQEQRITEGQPGSKDGLSLSYILIIPAAERLNFKNSQETHVCPDNKHSEVKG